MPIPVVISYTAAYLCLIVTLGVLLRDRHSFVHRAFAAGMLLFAAEELFGAMTYGAVLPDDAIYWHKRLVAASGLLPTFWLAFSVSYARAKAEALISKWKWILITVAVAPVIFI